MVGARELRNIGYIYDDEAAMAMSGTRTRRVCVTKKRLSNPYVEKSGSEEDSADTTIVVASAEADAGAKKPSMSEQIRELHLAAEEVRRQPPGQMTTHPPLSTKLLLLQPHQIAPPGTKAAAQKKSSTPRKRSITTRDEDSPKTPKRRKTTGTASKHFSTPAKDAKTPEKAAPSSDAAILSPAKLPTPAASTASQDPEDVVVMDAAAPPSPIASHKKSPAKGKQVPVTFTINDPVKDLKPLAPEVLQRISNKLHELGNRTEKPEPTGKPIVWSESRRELCEALPYYRAYKGGGYISEGIAHCFMFDNVAHPRDYIDSTVVIARAGGGMGNESKGGPMVLVRDQEGSAQVIALADNIKEFRPVGIIAGQYLSNMQSKMEHRYQFLDWFKPTDIWCEKTNGHVAVRYRFEKLRPQEPSWWTPAGEEDEVAEIKNSLDALEPASAVCRSCGNVSMQIYLNGWMCLREWCTNFWTLPDGTAPADDQLRYDPRFLKRRTKWPHSSTPWITRPDLLSFAAETTTLVGEGEDEGLGELTKSIVCPKCGRCTAAKYWTYWLCGNSACAYRVTLPQEKITRAGLRSLAHPITSGYSFSKDTYESEHISMQVSFVGNYRVQIYTIVGLENAFIAHMIANETVVEEKGGPDDMFMDLQNNEIGLERRAKDDSRIAGENLCDHFTLNFGMPYKFVASPDSKPFDEAPDAVKMARSQLIWAKKALGIYDGEPDFNELMVLGYKTANKIGYHDDGEEGLGPTVATLSVGCEAEMKIKMQEKHYRGFTGAGTFVDNLPPLPNSLCYEKRMRAYHELQVLKTTDRAAYNAKKKTLPKELGLTGKETRKSAPEILKMRLNHGDIVIMHGALLQRYYLHCVEPKGRRRFAFTCRNILEGHLKEEERPGYEVGQDRVGYDGWNLPVPE